MRFISICQTNSSKGYHASVSADNIIPKFRSRALWAKPELLRLYPTESIWGWSAECAHRISSIDHATLMLGSWGLGADYMASASCVASTSPPQIVSYFIFA